MKGFTHFDESGRAQMVDVGAKTATHRVALASGHIYMLSATLAHIQSGQTSKGDVLAVARVAAIQATKRTADLIPLCHPLALTRVTVDFAVHSHKLAIECRVTAETTGVTGVEMEALVGVSTGLLTIYDMCKAVDRGMRIGEIRLLEKKGGLSGHWRAADE